VIQSKSVDLTLQSADVYPPDDISNTYSLVVPKFAATRSVVCYCTSWSVGSYVDNNTTSTGLCVTQLPQPLSVTGRHLLTVVRNKGMCMV
jgi:hypothetical protein